MKIGGAGSGDGSSNTTASVGVAPAERVVVERKFKIQFAVDPELMEKLRKTKSLLSTKYQNGLQFQALFDILMTEYLDRHDPEKRIKKREQRRKNKKKRDRKKNKSTQDKKPAGGDNNIKRGDHNEASKKPKKRLSTERTRHIPQAVRDQVFVRDGGRCAFIGKNGKRCGETWNLEIDHIVPYAKGGSNSPDNLRLLCAKHNRLAAEKAYGNDHMEKFYKRE